MAKNEKKDEIVKVGGKKYLKEAFMTEEQHPALGRVMVVNGEKFRILDDYQDGGHKTGTFLKRFTESDQEIIDDYEETINALSSRLKENIDVEKAIKEQLKGRPIQELKTGLYILTEKSKGEKVEEEHLKGCYNYKIHKGDLMFELYFGENP